MKITPIELEGALLIEPAVFTDERGYFFESYHEERFTKAGITEKFVQDNQSLSSKGVIRGLHFQNPPYAQGKLVRVVSGAVDDIIVDIRKNSPTYGKHAKVRLTSENMLMLWIPVGFAHGFLTLTNNTLFLYKCTNVYNKNAEQGIIYNDKDLAIDWEFQNPLVSSKDLELGTFKNLVSEF
jgi:dTDP-4-dehydrorhamnose 3,5-epimerase